QDEIAFLLSGSLRVARGAGAPLEQRKRNRAVVSTRCPGFLRSALLCFWLGRLCGRLWWFWRRRCRRRRLDSLGSCSTGGRLSRFDIRALGNRSGRWSLRNYGRFG